MASLADTDVELDSVEAALNYVVNTGQRPVTHTAIPGEGPSRREGQYEARTVTIHDARPLARSVDLDREGFALCREATAVTDFYDDAEVREIYYPEVERLVKKATGAKRVVIFDYTVRNGSQEVRAALKVREPVYSVHNDHTESSGPGRLRYEIPGDEGEALLRGRFAIINVWRPIRGPVEADPIAICDARSLPAGDLIASTRKAREREGEVYQITYNPAHRWYYFPRMETDEALLLKVYDSPAEGRARWTAHTAFTDPTTPAGAPPRESIEVRTFAFF